MKKKTAQKLEVLPDYNAPELAIIGSSIAKAVTAIGSKTARYHDEIVYDIVGLGVLYLRAKERVGHGHFGAFLVNSATVADLKISERSAQNYMRAAENAGLTEKSTLKDIEALREKQALHGTKPTELYKLKDAAPPEEKDGQMQLSLVVEVLQAIEKDCDQAIILRDRMNHVEYEACWRRLKLTLEALTDSPWDMIDRETGTPASQRPDGRGRRKKA